MVVWFVRPDEPSTGSEMLITRQWTCHRGPNPCQWVRPRGGDTGVCCSVVERPVREEIFHSVTNPLRTRSVVTDTGFMDILWRWGRETDY